MMQYPRADKHGLAAGPQARPQRPDWTIDQGWERYAAAEHAVWRRLYERQAKLLPGRACDEFLDGMRRLPIGADEIPDFRRLRACEFLFDAVNENADRTSKVGRKRTRAS
jgi:phenylalanine-4-hydroxylase